MTPDSIQDILSCGEGLEVEFKEAFFELPKSTFDTVCAFLNRTGGHLLLGVSNSGAVEGVLEESAPKMVNDLVTAANNPQKLSPPFYLAPEIVTINGRTIISCYVPQSSQVHRTAGRIFDRNATDGDIDITDSTHQVTQLYLRKQQTYTENRIYPHVYLSDFRPDLIKRVRTMAGNQRTGHPWMDLSDEELLLSAGLRLKDPLTGQEGYTLAAVLLLGRDNAILSVLPHHKTDALLRVRDRDRYDDRDDIRTNLIESYDRLMLFSAKHLPDPFYLQGTQRVSLRGKIFREVVANLLVHREFANAYPAKFIIAPDGVHTENWNRPHHHGLLIPGKALPYPKNPVMARFFREIGLAEELGSGLRNAFQFVPEYSGGGEPVFEEGDVFRCFIPVPASFFDQPNGKKRGGDTENESPDTVNDTVKRIYDTVNDTVNDGVSEDIKQRLVRIISILRERPGLKSSAMAAQLQVTEVTIRRDIQKISSLVRFQGAPKTGGYYLNKSFKEKIEQNNSNAGTAEEAAE